MAFFKFALLGLAAVGAAVAAPQLSEDPDFLRAQRLGEAFDEHPVYTYAFQVADEDEQTYIAKEESRDGDNTVGKYQYVDATGSLVRVEYVAGPMGYTEERFVEPNFVAIRARPASVSRTQTTTTSSSNSGAANSGFVSSSVSGSGFGSRTQTTTTTTSNDQSSSSGNSALVGSIVRRVTPAVQRVVTTETSSSSSSSESDSDLVSRIIAQLTPFIQRTVSDSLSTSGQTTTTTTRRVQAVQQPTVQAVRRVVTTTTNSAPVAATATTQIFGTGGANNIRFENPDINYSFDLE